MRGVMVTNLTRGHGAMILPTISESSDYSYVFLTNKNNTNLHATNKNIFVCL
jgi:hypothetical protein